MKIFCKMCSLADNITPEKAGVLTIIISLITAVIMISSSYLIKDTQYAENAQMITYIIILLWWFPFYVLTRRSRVDCNIKK